FRPRSTSQTTTATPQDLSSVYPKEDPIRSRYAFVLALVCSVAVGLLLLDFAAFVYFAIYPREKGALLHRASTIGPIVSRSRPPLPQSITGDDSVGAENQEKQQQPQRPRRSQQQQQPEDKYTSLPPRNSGFSTTTTSSGYRRSRRLSKPAPENWDPRKSGEFA
ncbi:hypothetical protein FRC15_008220, partial [Serendipita sp. 397]